MRCDLDYDLDIDLCADQLEQEELEKWYAQQEFWDAMTIEQKEHQIREMLVYTQTP